MIALACALAFSASSAQAWDEEPFNNPIPDWDETCTPTEFVTYTEGVWEEQYGGVFIFVVYKFTYGWDPDYEDGPCTEEIELLSPEWLKPDFNPWPSW